MKNTLRKLLAMMMSLMMLCGSLPVNVLAEGIDNMMPELGDDPAIVLPMQDASDAFSLAGDGGIALLADNPAPSGGVYLNQVMTSKYSATAWDDYKSGTTVTTFIGSTRYVRYRIQPQGSTGKVKVVVKQYLNGQPYNDNYPIDRIGDKGDSWDPDTNTFILNTVGSTASVYPVGFTPTEDMKAGDEISFELLVYDEDGEDITYDVKSGYGKEVKFIIQSEDKKYDYEIQLYRAIEGDGGVYSYNSSDKVDFTAGTEIRFKVQIHSLCDKDMYIQLIQAWDADNVSSTMGLTDLTYKIVERDGDPENKALITDGMVFLPAGATVILAADAYNEFTLTPDSSGKDMKFTYTVTAQLDKEKTGADIDYQPKEEKAVTCTQVDELGKNKVGYNLAISTASFPGVAFDDQEHDMGNNIKIVANGTSAGGAQKWVHTETYTEGTKVQLTGVKPVDSAGNTFLFWYDKRAMGDERFVRSNGFIFKDNTNDHTVDAIWAYIPAEDEITIHDGDIHCVQGTSDIQLVGENNEYSNDSVMKLLQKKYYFTVVKYVPDGNGGTTTAEIKKGPFSSVAEFENDPDWTQTEIGHYEYKVSASVWLVEDDTETEAPLDTISATADVTILPRPVVVVANSATYGFDGKAHDVKAEAAVGSVPADRPYTVWENTNQYFNDDSINAEIYGILQEVYQKATGETMPGEDVVKYTTSDVYLASGSWNDSNVQKAQYVPKNEDKDDGDDDETAPGKYTAYLVMNLALGEPVIVGDNYKAYVVGNYAYIVYDGELDITPAYLQFDKTVKDDSVESATFTFKVTGPNGPVKFKNVGGELIEDPDGDIESFTLTYNGTNPVTSERLTVYTSTEGLTYTVTESNIVRTPTSDKTYKTEYEWTCTNGEEEELSGDGNSVQIPMGETGKVHVSNIMEPEISLDKSFDGTVPTYNGVRGFKAGDKITWTLTVTNTGNRTLHDVKLTDELTGVKITKVESSNMGHTFQTPYTNPLPLGTMAVGEVITVTVEYEVTQDDVDAHKDVHNEATVTGKDSDDEEVDDDGEDDEPTVWDPAIELTKTVKDLPSVGYYEEGGQIVWTLRVENTGTVTLHNVEVTDPLTGNTFTSAHWVLGNGTWSGPAGTLKPGETVEFTTSAYTVTAADVAKGTVYNEATVTAKDPDEGDVTDDSDDTEKVAHPGILIEKKLNGDVPVYDGVTGFKLNDTITWTLTVTNTGTVTLHDVVVTDPLTGDIFTAADWEIGNGTWYGGDNQTAGTLEPGETVTFTTSGYTVTQEDVDAGKVLNTATVTGKDPQEKDVTSTDKDEEPTGYNPSIDIVKDLDDATPDDGYELNDEITWTLVVTNDGTVTLKNVVVEDELDGVKITNVVSSVPSHVIEAPYTNPLNLGTMVVGEYVTITVTYTVTQEDVDAGEVYNNATVTGKGPKDEDVDDEDDDTEPTNYHPLIEIVKTLVGEAPEGGYALNDTITWTLTVTNIGTVTLTNVEVEDELTGNIFTADDWEVENGTWASGDDATAGTLEPGETVTFTTAVYTVTQADVDAGHVYNVATVKAKDPKDKDVTDDDDDDELTNYDPAIEIVKTLVGEAPEGGYKLNDTITWTLTVTNIGTVTLTNVEVEDELTGNTFTADDWVVENGTWASGDDATAGTLEPGETVTFTTAVYTVTQADVDAGHVYNVATVEAKDPTDKDVTDDDDDDEPTDREPAIKIVKTLVGEAPEGGYKLNDTIIWLLVVTNTGNVTLHDVKVEDELTGNTFTAKDWDAANGTWASGDDATAGTLEPGETVTFTTAVYTVTQADVDAGHVYNVATVKATDPRDDDTEDPEDRELEDEDDDDEPTRHDPAIAITKTLADPGSKPAAGYGEGDTITWTVTVTNTGNLTLHNVVLTDELTGVTITNVESSDAERSFDGPYTNPLTIGTLAVGEVVTVTVDYVVTTADVLAKDVTNKARANGEDPDGEPVEDEDDDTEPTVEAKPHLSLTKVTTSKPANGTAYVNGEVITYEIVVTNDGNVMLVDVTVEDELTGNVWTVPSLAPGESATFTTKHTVTADDVAAGHVLNVAMADSYVPKDPGDPSHPGNPNDPSNPNDPADPNDPNHAQRVTADPCSVDDPTTMAVSPTPTETPTSTPTNAPTNTPTTPNTVTSNPPKTGDDSQMSLWMALLIISACGVLVMLIPARKRMLGHKGKNK